MIPLPWGEEPWRSGAVDHASSAAPSLTLSTTEILPMTDVSLPTTGLAGARAGSARRPRRRSPLAWLLEAMHHARRRQARRVLRAHADLLAPISGNLRHSSFEESEHVDQ